MSDNGSPRLPFGDGDAANEISLEERLQMVQAEHRVLDLEIAALYQYPYRDQLQLQRLKKKKLQLKDLIERLKDELIPDLNA
ncbi:MAG: DUF465 domain-containing protein [Halieaceae bacterium]|jgi:hypothetical protein|nr:DUF465 domain-containing protein [Halieaceae bacterium]